MGCLQIRGGYHLSWPRCRGLKCEWQRLSLPGGVESCVRRIERLGVILGVLIHIEFGIGAEFLGKLACLNQNQWMLARSEGWGRQ